MKQASFTQYHEFARKPLKTRKAEYLKETRNNAELTVNGEHNREKRGARGESPRNQPKNIDCLMVNLPKISSSLSFLSKFGTLREI